MKTKYNHWIPLLLISNLILICSALYFFINLNYPLVGHDYRLAIPSMLDTIIHFQTNGLSIQWYTPSFGGGIPAYPNPNNGQFSILEILPLWMTPWQAVFISTVIYISLGFFASYQFFYKIISLNWTSSLLGAVFFSANGFMMERMAAGHLGYQPFPLLAIILLLLLENTFPVSISSVLLGVTLSILLHQAGYFLIVVFGLSISITLPIIQIIRPNQINWKRLVFISLLGGVVGLLISASKLSAVYSFMRAFPRFATDSYLVSAWTGFFGLILQLLGTMNLVPLLTIARIDINLLPKFLTFTTGAPYGYWEFDMSLSPIIFLLILAGCIRFFHAPKIYAKKYFAGKNLPAFFCLIFFLWVALEFTLATGLIYPILQKLPILSSLHVNPRFAAAFLFPIAFIAAWLYNTFSKQWSNKKAKMLFLSINLLTLIPLLTYFSFSDDIQIRIYDLTLSDQIYQSIRKGESFQVTGISKVGSNTDAIMNGLSNLDLYDPIFGYALEKFHPEIHPGPIWKKSNGYFNMTNPAGFVFPEVNDSYPFERFKLADREKMEKFSHYKQPAWIFPAYQIVCNWISLISFVLVLFFLGLHGIQYLLTFIKIKKFSSTHQ